MKKSIAVLFCLFSLPAFADSEATIKLIHEKTDEAITELCKDKMKMSANVCKCLGNKAQTNLNDKALAQCKADDKECNTKEIERAMFQALAKESVNDCVANNKEKTAAN